MHYTPFKVARSQILKEVYHMHLLDVLAPMENDKGKIERTNHSRQERSRTPIREKSKDISQSKQGDEVPLAEEQ
ncbi:hypothetical protein CR513_34118, partial [Mucuna pruriens]